MGQILYSAIPWMALKPPKVTLDGAPDPTDSIVQDLDNIRESNRDLDSGEFGIGFTAWIKTGKSDDGQGPTDLYGRKDLPMEHRPLYSAVDPLEYSVGK